MRYTNLHQLSNHEKKPLLTTFFLKKQVNYKGWSQLGNIMLRHYLSQETFLGLYIAF